MFVKPQSILGVLGPDKHPRIIKDRSGLLLVGVDVVDMFCRRLNRTSGVTGDFGCEGASFTGSHVRDLVRSIQGFAEMVGLWLGPHVKPADDEGKEVCPQSHDGITRISREVDKIVEIHQKVYNGKEKRDKYPDDVHRHGDRPLSRAFGCYFKVLPVSIVLG